jgi:hypothetical protein
MLKSAGLVEPTRIICFKSMGSETLESSVFTPNPNVLFSKLLRTHAEKLSFQSKVRKGSVNL